MPFARASQKKAEYEDKQQNQGKGANRQYNKVSFPQVKRTAKQGENEIMEITLFLIDFYYRRNEIRYKIKGVLRSGYQNGGISSIKPSSKFWVSPFPSQTEGL